MSGLIKARTTGTFGESTVSKILELVENSENGKANTEKLITRFAKIYIPIVVIGAVLLAAILTTRFRSRSAWRTTARPIKRELRMSKISQDTVSKRLWTGKQSMPETAN